MTKYTYDRGRAARYGDGAVIVPDQVADDQRGFDGRAFPALRASASGARLRGAPVKVRVRLDGAAYGLHTPGTGDMVVRAA